MKWVFFFLCNFGCSLKPRKHSVSLLWNVALDALIMLQTTMLDNFGFVMWCCITRYKQLVTHVPVSTSANSCTYVTLKCAWVIWQMRCILSLDPLSNWVCVGFHWWVGFCPSRVYCVPLGFLCQRRQFIECIELNAIHLRSFPHFLHFILSPHSAALWS